MQLLTATQESLVVKLIIVFSCTCVHRSTGATIRLVNGSATYEGRVEVYYRGRWGTVCDDGWDLDDAQVVCRQLGFDSAIGARTRAFYGEGSGRIWLDNVDCVGTELTIEDCPSNGWGDHNCDHHEDAGVQCSNGYGDLRISGDGSSGRLEFRLDDGTWGYVCSSGFYGDAARVACRQLGYTSGQYNYSYPYHYYYYNYYDDYAICFVYCYGNESRLIDCYLSNCSHSYYHNYCYGAVIISCYGQSTPSSTYVYVYPTSTTSSSGGADDDDDNHVYPGLLAAGLLVLIIAGIVIIGIVIVIKKKKSIRQSQQTARVAVATPSHASVVHYTYPSVSTQAPINSQSYPNPVSAQQQTPQGLTGNEAAMTSISSQAAVYYPHYHGPEHAAAFGLTCNQSALPGGYKPAINPPSYSACTGEHAPDGSTNNQPMFLPPDYASATSTSASVQVSPATNS